MSSTPKVQCLLVCVVCILETPHPVSQSPICVPSAAVRLLREELQLLQEPGSYVGEVVKVSDPSSSVRPQEGRATDLTGKALSLRLRKVGTTDQL